MEIYRDETETGVDWYTVYSVIFQVPMQQYQDQISNEELPSGTG